MGYFTAAEQRASLENPSTPLSDPDAWLYDAFGARQSRAGVQISQTTALNLAAVWAAVRVLTDTLASLPLPVYERMQPRGKKRAPQHAVYRLLHDRPNPEMTSFTFRECSQGHLATWGNSYAEIERSQGGRPLNLWPITPNRVTPLRRNGERWYRVDLGGGEDTFLDADHMLHIPGFGYDGQQGYSPITMARESLGLAKATEDFGATWFSNGSRVSGVLQHPDKLGDTAHKHLRESIERIHQGLDNAHRLAILEEGMTWQQVGIPPNDAQFLETRKFQTTEIARWFKVPPHMIGDLERATFSNIEHQGIEFVVHTARPWLVRWEQVLNHDLFSERERGKFFAEFVIDGLLRGDSEARSNFYKAGINNGWFSPNDVLEMENKNPIPGGDRYFVRRDLIPLDSVDALVESLAPDPAPNPAPEPDDEPREAAEPAEARESREMREIRTISARKRLRETHEPLFRQVADSVVRREVDAMRSALGKAFGGREAARLRELVDEFFDTHDEWVAERFLVALRAYLGVVATEAAREVDSDVPDDVDDFAQRYAETMGRRWTGSSAGQMRQLIRDTPPDELESAVEERLVGWEDTRAEKESAREVVEAGEAVTALVFGAAGFPLKWRNTGASTCFLCQSMDGRVVPAGAHFLGKGDTLEGNEDTAPLTTRFTIRHPPLHQGCDCALVPGI